MLTTKGPVHSKKDPEIMQKGGIYRSGTRSNPGILWDIL